MHEMRSERVITSLLRRWRRVARGHRDAAKSHGRSSPTLPSVPPIFMTAPGQLRISNDMSPRKIHILSVIDDLHFGGDEYRLYAFAKSLDKCRFDHTVLTLMKEDRTIGAKYGSMRDQYRQAGICLIDIGQTAAGARARRGKTITNRLFSAWEKTRRLASLIREERVDVLDVHLTPANLVGAVAALNAGIPFAVTLYQVNTMQSSKLWLAGQFNLGSAAMLITDSESQATVASRWLMH